MLLHILDDQHVRLEFDDSEGLEVHGSPFGPLQMLAASLALCTASVMQDYATTAQFHLHDLAIDLAWHYAEEPYRVGQMHMRLEIGPDVPPSRHKALLRAAEHHCTVHNTLSHSTHIHTKLEVVGAEQA
jgi:uncharacterized OsmC-like protein